jgi:hypothetical protein
VLDSTLGPDDGARDGVKDGPELDFTVGPLDGCEVDGEEDGKSLGCLDGFADNAWEGAADGTREGLLDGPLESTALGSPEGFELGTKDGGFVGAFVTGNAEGLPVTVGFVGGDSVGSTLFGLSDGVSVGSFVTYTATSIGPEAITATSVRFPSYSAISVELRNGASPT